MAVFFKGIPSSWQGLWYSYDENIKANTAAERDDAFREGKE